MDLSWLSILYIYTHTHTHTYTTIYTPYHCIYIYHTTISKPYGNCKPKIYNRYTFTKEEGIQTENHQIKRKDNKIGSGENTNKNKSRTINERAIRTYTLNIHIELP